MFHASAWKHFHYNTIGKYALSYIFIGLKLSKLFLKKVASITLLKAPKENTQVANKPQEISAEK